MHSCTHTQIYVLKFSTHIHVLNLTDRYFIDGLWFYNGSTIRRLWKSRSNPKVGLGALQLDSLPITVYYFESPQSLLLLLII